MNLKIIPKFGNGEDTNGLLLMTEKCKVWKKELVTGHLQNIWNLLAGIWRFEYN